MSKHSIKQIIESIAQKDGLTNTGIEGVQLFRATTSVPCIPAVYEPCVVAIVSGSKEAILDGERHIYGEDKYLCCPMSMPVQAGTPNASAKNPLFGVFISLDQRVMTELIIEMGNVTNIPTKLLKQTNAQGIKLAHWNHEFSDTLSRLVELLPNAMDTSVLGNARLREVLYAVLKGDAGDFMKRAFGAGNTIARSIAHISEHLDEPISIDDMAQRAGMSRAVFHRKFKQATTMSPIQFVKSMRLNNAAMKIASGVAINEAALEVGYLSPSQFSREFKRTYGQSPRQWIDTQRLPTGFL